MKCKIDDCSNSVKTKELCIKHYTRFLKYGDASIVRRAWGRNRKAHPLHSTYHQMIARCHKPNNNGYHKYGARGITVDPRWLGIEGFDNFISDMGERPTPKHSIDRIDNDGGYTPKNCRWATKSKQSYNRRFWGNSTGYKGVYLKKTGAYTAVITSNKRRYYLGTFQSIKEANEARSKAETIYEGATL